MWTVAVGPTAAGLALFVSTAGAVRLIAGTLGAAALLVMLWWRPGTREHQSSHAKKER
jgi:hypothetical protein